MTELNVPGIPAASVAEWIKRVKAVLKAAEADGVEWEYEADYCEADGCVGCCRTSTPLTASRGDGHGSICLY